MKRREGGGGEGQLERQIFFDFLSFLREHQRGQGRKKRRGRKFPKKASRVKKRGEGSTGTLVFLRSSGAKKKKKEGKRRD